MTNRLRRTTATMMLLSALAGTAHANEADAIDPGAYDNRSAVSYRTLGAEYQGRDAATVARWNAGTGIGIIRGVDENGHTWVLDTASGMYQNFGTGEVAYRPLR